jgi:GNAT superfamily N-acetyltransferase
MPIRFATVDDAETLGTFNGQLIRDEGHRNSMTVSQLLERMTQWLRTDYEAAVVEVQGTIVGYALFRREADFVYLRQIFVRAENRRCGIARSLVQWLAQNAWPTAPRVRIDVLVGNDVGRRFWESIGFREYCLTMEMELLPGSGREANSC